MSDNEVDEKVVLPELTWEFVRELEEFITDGIWHTPDGFALCFLDHRGLPLLLEAAAGTLPWRIELAQVKARTAFIRARDSGPPPEGQTLADYGEAGRQLTTRMGGVILRNHEGKIIGAIGLSGLGEQQDRTRLHVILRRHYYDCFQLDSWPGDEKLVALDKEDPTEPVEPPA